MKSLKYLLLLILISSQLFSLDNEIIREFNTKIGDLNLYQNTLEKDIPKSPTSSKYLLFNNFNLDASHTAFAQEAYIDPINTDPILKSLFTIKAWDQTTAKEVLNYDLVVFPLGDVPINTPANGVAVITKIRELIQAGKKILITGRNVLAWAFNSQSQFANAEIQKFFRDTLGINYIGKVPVSVTNGSLTTFYGYVNQGDYKDPAAFGTRIESNVKFKNGTQQYETPIAYYTHVDGFKTIDETKFSPTYHFNSYGSDTLLCTKAKFGDAKILLWTVGFENFSLSSARLSALQYNINWLMEGAPEPGANIEFNASTIKFGNVAIGETSQQTLSFKNNGLADLEVTELFIDWDDYNVYKFEQEPTLPLKLKTGEAASIVIKFTPKENIAYDAICEVISNSVNSSDKIISLSGSGGSGSGPILTTDLMEDKLDFGEVVKGYKKIIPFNIQNEGNEDLEITKISLTRNDSTVFFHDQGSAYPWTIKVKDVYYMKMRFTPMAENVTYLGTLELENNGLNASPFKIQMIGKGIKFVDVEEQEQFDNFSLFPNPAKDRINIKSLNSFDVINIQVFDNNGKNLNFKDFSIINNNTIEMNTSKLFAGTYYIKIVENSKSQYLPLIIFK